ncbi:hypothetical protein RIF29_23708 [Crotalaria pallida]|uniref:Uncharacterized protein n=1 Tax=Crotalaria pallida TaxID=3830 RepID=A0AAN9FAN5_CROPI
MDSAYYHGQAHIESQSSKKTNHVVAVDIVLLTRESRAPSETGVSFSSVPGLVSMLSNFFHFPVSHLLLHHSSVLWGLEREREKENGSSNWLLLLLDLV